jgi:zinc protease
MKRKLIGSLCLCIGIITCHAQINLSEKLELDKSVTTGVLPNGLTYFIQPNGRPEKKVELRLVVKAGSIDEDDDQQGLAHMAEHMAFNGTKNFKKNEIVSFLQDIGVGFGNDLNANTSFDRTYYILPIPTDKPGNLEKGFQVLEDWAHNVTYYNEDIDNERAVILEESRLGKGAQDRMFKKILPKYLKGSKYANRLPIGVDSIIKNFKHDAIKRFYRDWYRPNLMAVIVVGDITVEKAKALIDKHFTGLKNPVGERQRQAITQPPYVGEDAIVVTDKEATSYFTGMSFSPFVEAPKTTFADIKSSMVQIMYASILNQRLQELTQKENPPFVFAQGNFGTFVKGYNQFGLNIGTGVNDPVKGVKVAVEELERMNKFGVTAAELDRIKKRFLTQAESEYNNRDKRESIDIADGIFAYFNDQEPFLNPVTSFNASKEIINSTTVAEVNKVSNLIGDKQHKVAVIMGPEPMGDKKIATEKELLLVINEAEKAEVKPYEEKAVAAKLLAAEPKPGKIIATKVIKELGATRYQLSNGAAVTVKKTDFKPDEIILDANRFGGKGSYNIKDKYSADYAITVAETMGYGDFTPTDLRKTLAGKNVRIGGQINDNTDGFYGTSNVKDFETMLQLLYLKTTAPRIDTALFKSFVQKNKAQLAMISANPQAVFVDTLYKVMYNNNPLSNNPVPNAANFDKISVIRAIEIYKEHVSDVNGMEFAIVGNYDEATIKPLIEKYIASLPATKRKFMYTDNKVRLAKGKKNINVYRGKEEKSLVIAAISGEVPYSDDLNLKAQALTEILNIQIIEELREKVQGIYGGGIGGGLEKYPYAHYQFSAQLPCGPEKADTLTQELFKLMNNIKTKGTTTAYLDKVKKQWIEKHKEGLKENGTWIKQIQEVMVDKKDPKRFLDYEKIVNNLTPNDVKLVANQLLNNNNVLVAQLMPKRYESGDEEIEKRKNTVKETIEVTNPFVTLQFFDDGVEDGDSITVYVNSKKIVSQKRLSYEPVTIPVKLVRGVNEIAMYADNNGTIPPNTALLKVIADKKEYKIELKSDDKTNGVVRIKVK